MPIKETEVDIDNQEGYDSVEEMFSDMGIDLKKDNLFHPSLRTKKVQGIDNVFDAIIVVIK